MSINYGQVKQTARERVFNLLSDMKWHRHTELSVVGGNRYGARLLELRRAGYEIESIDLGKTPGTNTLGKSYRLKSITAGKPQPKRVKVFLTEQSAAKLLDGQITGTAKAAIKDALGSFRTNKGKL